MRWDDVTSKKDDTSRNNDVITSPQEKISIKEVQIPTSQNLLDDSSCTTNSKVKNDGAARMRCKS
jgi:hypothetical protein